MELLDLEITQPSAEHADDILRLPDARRRRTVFPGEAGGQLEGRDQTGGLGGTDALGPKQLRRRALRQAAERALGRLEQPACHILHALPLRPCPYQDGKKFHGRQRGRTEGPETLAGTIRVEDGRAGGGHAGR